MTTTIDTTMKRNPILLLHFAAALCAAPLASAQTAFTYQGKLVDDCCPATGLYDMRFKVLDAPTGGTQYNWTWLVPSVPVTNGMFTARLDFGEVPFDGGRRWLEIEVRTNNPAPSAPFALLSPRTELTPTPYAIHALSANTVSSNSIHGFNISAGQVVKSLNGVKDNVTISGGSNVTVTTSGNNIVVSATGGGSNAPWQQSGGNLYYSGGKVGVGTANPAHALDVNGQIMARSGLLVPWGPIVTVPGGRNTNLLSMRWDEYNGDQVDLQVPGIFPNSAIFSFTSTGKLGVGTTDPAGTLSLYNSSSDLIFKLEDRRTATSGDFLSKQAFYDWSGGPPINGPEAAYIGLRHNMWWGPTARALVFGVSDNNETGPAEKMRIDYNGKVGIGTDSPSAPLHVSTAANLPLLKLSQTGGGNWCGLNMGNASGGNWEMDITWESTPSLLFYAGSNYAFGSDWNGNFSVRTLTIRGGADLAEPFQMSEDKIPEGSVVVIDEENPGHLKQATSAYDTRVAGIVSGANGVKAGIALHQEGALEGGQNVALTGRVYVKADASFGAIKPGDLLTTSDTPGHAMKVLNHELAQGAILGKAMTALSEGTGMVLVLVSLQ
jgi:hypothetical protein